eukprot:6185557-Pleurochrysis_carterae.AAC.2
MVETNSTTCVLHFNLATVTDQRRCRVFGASPRATFLAARTMSSPAPAQQDSSPAHHLRGRQLTNTTVSEGVSVRRR